MYKLTKLKINNITISPEIKEFLSPEYVYIPIYKDYSLIVKDNQIIKKDEQVLINKEGNVICSPISGMIVGITEKKQVNRAIIKTVVIQNDYKEETKRNDTKDLKKATTEDFFNNIKKYIYLNKSYENDLINHISLLNTNPKTLILKCFDDDPYMKNSIFILKDNMEKILTSFDFILDLFKIKEGFLILKEIDSDIITQYRDFIGTFPKIKIKLIEDVYPLFKNSILIENVFKLKNYNKDDIVVLTLSDLIRIYNATKCRKQVTEKYITMTGSGIENPSVIKTKIGTKLIEVIENCIKINSKELVYNINGLMRGYLISDLYNYIITEDFEGIVIDKKNELKSQKCINCGKCYDICPAHINPKSPNDKKCIHCNLCSYICPSNITLREERDEPNE